MYRVVIRYFSLYYFYYSTADFYAFLYFYEHSRTNQKTEIIIKNKNLLYALNIVINILPFYCIYFYILYGLNTFLQLQILNKSRKILNHHTDE